MTPPGHMVDGEEVGASPASQDRATPATPGAPAGLRHSGGIADAEPLVELFNTPEGYRHFGRRGDYEGWSPEQTAAHFLAEYAARLSAADARLVGLPAAGTLRLCGYCRSWNSKPCGEQCLLSASDPTWEQANAQAGVTRMGGDLEQGSVAEGDSTRSEGCAQ